MVAYERVHGMGLRKGIGAFAVLPPLALVALAAYGGQERAVPQAAPAEKAAKRQPSETAVAANTAPVRFRKEIEPFLKARCSGCHSVDGHSSGLNVETPEALFKGGAKYG